MGIDDLVKDELFTSSKDELIRAKNLIEDYLIYLTTSNDDERFKEIEEEEQEVIEIENEED